MHIIPVWDAAHPGHDVLRRVLSTELYPGPRDVFSTDMLEPNRLVIGDLVNRLTGDRGHILVRAKSRGETYRVITIDDTSESFEVTGVFGPYQSS